MLKYIGTSVVLSVLVFTACDLSFRPIEYWTGCSKQSAFEKHVGKMENRGVVVMEVTSFFNASAPFTLGYKYNIGGEDFFKSIVLTNVDDESYFIPKGGKYLMSYNKLHPKNNMGRNRHHVALYLPVYDSTQVFERTITRVEKVYFIEQRGTLHYGGIQLIFSFKVGNKEYISHNGINLCEKFPNVQNPAMELQFEGKKFMVEYDVDNPYIARILLNKPVAEDKAEFEKARAKVEFITKRNFRFYLNNGFIEIGCRYSVKGKSYLLKSKVPKDLFFPNKDISEIKRKDMRELNRKFNGKYCTVEYNINDPSESRLVIDSIIKGG